MKVDLAVSFSEKTFDYDSARELTTYLETDPNADNSSLGHVTLKSLDDRSLGGRVGKRDSQLNQIGACMFHGKNQFFRRLKRRIAVPSSVPSSSEIAAKMKSFSTTGIFFGIPW